MALSPTAEIGLKLLADGVKIHHAVLRSLRVKGLVQIVGHGKKTRAALTEAGVAALRRSA